LNTNAKLFRDDGSLTPTVEFEKVPYVMENGVLRPVQHWSPAANGPMGGYNPSSLHNDAQLHVFATEFYSTLIPGAKPVIRIHASTFMQAAR